MSASSNFPKKVGSIINETFSIRTNRRIKRIEYLYLTAISLKVILISAFCIVVLNYINSRAKTTSIFIIGKTDAMIFSMGL
jgi:hypothetical protein